MKTLQESTEQDVLRINLSIVTAEGERFIDELERLCEKFSIEKDYLFTFE